MADVTKDSFNEDNLHTKVIVQRGRDVHDFELNELQDILRVTQARQMNEGAQNSVTGALNPASNDDGFLLEGTGASNQATLKAGYLFCDGIPVPKTADSTQTGFVTAGADRIDTVYLTLTEVEIADPAQVPQIGETTRRRQLQYTIGISVTGEAGVPADTVAEIHEGGVRHFKLANVTRRAGDPLIQAADVEDLRHLLPPSVIAQMTRQSNHRVQALVGSIIETPDGTLLPTTATFLIDIDPTAAVADIGTYFQVRTNRDASPFDLFKSTVLSATTMRWEAGRLLQLRDKTIADTEGVSGVASIPLTGVTAGEGDSYPRVMDRPVIGTGKAAPSLVKGLNRHWTATCGDGTNTFGDFNGVTAVNDALTFFETYVRSSTSFDGVRIHLKRGGYNLPTTAVSAGAHVIIEGEYASETSLSYAGTALEVLVNSLYELRDLRVVYASGVSRTMVRVTDARIRLSRVSFIGGSLHIVDPATASSDAKNDSAVVARECYFNTRNSAVGCLVFEAASTGTYRGFLFEDCSFVSDTAAVLTINGNTTVAARLRGIEFRRCRMDLAGATVTGGNPDKNVGVLELVPVLVNELTTVEDISFVDCEVNGYAQAATGTAHFLLYVRTGPSGAQNVILNSLKIKGGRWTCPADSFATSSLGLVSVGSSAPASVTGKVKSVSIEDVTIGYRTSSDTEGAGSVYGAPPTDAAMTFAAAVCIAADRVRIRDVRWWGATAASTRGELALENVDELDIDGFVVASTGAWNAGTGVVPDARMFAYCRARTNGDRVMRRVVYEAKSGTPSIVGASGSIIAARPNGGLLLEDCSFLAVRGGPSIRLAAATTSQQQTTGLRLSRIVSTNADGLLKHVNGGTASEGDLRDLSVEGCLASYTSAVNPVDIDFATGGTTATVVNCIFRNNILKPGGAAVGISVTPSAWDADSALVLQGNSIETAGGDGMKIGKTGVNDVQGITCFGNVVRGGSRFIRLVGTLVAASGRKPRGFQTGYAETGAGGEVQQADSVYSAGSIEMMFNDAVLSLT